MSDMELHTSADNDRSDTETFLRRDPSGNISSESTGRATSPLNQEHESRGQTLSPWHTPEESFHSFTLVGASPISSTLSPSFAKPASAEAPLLSSPSQSKPHNVSKRGSSWNWEITALLFSFSTLTTLVILLIYVDKRTLSQWNGILSLNTLVSTLGAISRTSLAFAISSCLSQAKWNWYKRRGDNLIAFDRFDDASRGPWGSLWLIIWVRARHWVAIGAMVSIILIGFEPLLQAVISFSGQMDINANSSGAQLGRSETVLDIGSYFSAGPDYRVFVTEIPNTSVEFQSYLSLPDLGMLASFNHGFYNSSNNAGQTTSFTCPTANCTWPIFTSLAVCSACNNMKSLLRRFTQEGNNLGTIKYAYSYHEKKVANFTTYSLPGLNFTNINNSNGTKDKYAAYMAATTITDPQLTLSFNNLTTMITALQVLKAEPGYEKGEMIWDNTSVSATECALYFCVNAYHSVVEKGALKEDIIASWAQRDFSSYHLDDKGQTEGSTYDHYETYEKWNNYSLYTGAGDYQRRDLRLFIPPQDAEKYTMPEDSVLSFNLTESTVGSTVHFVNEQLLKPNMAWPLAGGGSTNGTSTAQALYQSTDLSTTFDNVAWAVSNWIRDISSVRMDGVEQEWVVHIHVEWSYMILPILTIVVGLLYCLWSMLETRKLHLHPWKTDVVATLMHSVDAETRAQLIHADQNGNLKEAVKATSVKLVDTGFGLELRTQQI